VFFSLYVLVVSKNIHTCQGCVRLMGVGERIASLVKSGIVSYHKQTFVN